MAKRKNNKIKKNKQQILKEIKLLSLPKNVMISLCIAEIRQIPFRITPTPYCYAKLTKEKNWIAPSSPFRDRGWSGHLPFYHFLDSYVQK